MSPWHPVLVLGVLTCVVSSQDLRLPDDPFLPDQASLYHRGGQLNLRLSSSAEGTETCEAREGVHHDLPRAWALTTGSRSVVVALLDDGFFYDHEDLAANIWRNPGEAGPDGSGLPKEANGRDDDGNGYVDDVMGWDFVFGDPDPDGYVFDGMDRSRIQPYAHSTPAMGIIGAAGTWKLVEEALELFGAALVLGAVWLCRAATPARAAAPTPGPAGAETRPPGLRMLLPEDLPPAQRARP